MSRARPKDTKFLFMDVFITHNKMLVICHDHIMSLSGTNIVFIIGGIMSVRNFGFIIKGVMRISDRIILFAETLFGIIIKI